jgi:hypothetical protein
MKSFHPEIQQGEIFISNMNGEQFQALGWLSKRKGTVAYDGEGGQLNFADWFPVFIQTAELERRNVSLRDLRTALRWRPRRAA